MNSNQIHSCLRKYPQFIGVFASDVLPNPLLVPPPPIALVVNTDPSSKPGKHWVCIFVSKHGYGEYFDSYALPPLIPSIVHFLYSYCGSNWNYNTRRLQGDRSSTCGHYVTAYLSYRCSNISPFFFLSKFKISNFDFNDRLIAKSHSATCSSPSSVSAQTCRPLL